MTQQSPKRILLLSHARTASHLFGKLLSQQPNVAYGAHPFVMARPLSVRILEKPLEEADSESKAALMKAWQDAYTFSWEPFFAQAAEDGKIAFMHIHPHFSMQPALASAFVHGNSSKREDKDEEAWVVKSSKGGAFDTHSLDNPEVLPDMELLAPGTRPLILIRHPALMMPSIYRTILEVGRLNTFENASWQSQVFSCTLRWQRMVYDFYVNHGPSHGINPLIVDADDIQGPGRKEYMDRLCAEIGLDGGAVLYEWSKASKEELEGIPEAVVQIKKTIFGSEKVIEGLDSKSLNLEEENRKWDQTFGEEHAKHVREFVAKAMDDYEYMKAKKFV